MREKISDRVVGTASDVIVLVEEKSPYRATTRGGSGEDMRGAGGHSAGVGGGMMRDPSTSTVYLLSTTS